MNMSVTGSSPAIWFGNDAGRGRQQLKVSVSHHPLSAIAYATSRLGLVATDNEVEAIVTRLLRNPIAPADENIIVAKMVVDDERRRPKLAGDPLWLQLPLQRAEWFIKQRYSEYPTKTGARMFFHDDLMQYFAWTTPPGLDEAAQ